MCTPVRIGQRLQPLPEVSCAVLAIQKVPVSLEEGGYDPGGLVHKLDTKMPDARLQQL